MSIRRKFGTRQLCEIENRPIPNKFTGPLTTGKGTIKFAQRANYFLQRGNEPSQKRPAKRRRVQDRCWA